MNMNSWPSNLSQVAYLHAPILQNISISITADPNYYNLVYNAKSTGNTDTLKAYLQNKVSDITYTYLSNSPQLAVVLSIEDETGPWVDSTTNTVSSCSLNSAINQLNSMQTNSEYSYNAKGYFPSALYVNGLGVDSWIGYFNNSGPSPSPHFRLGVILFWFSC